MTDIRYELAGEEKLDCIKELWESLNELHRQKSPHFKRHYETNTFEKRKSALLRSAQSGQLLVALAQCGGAPVGYCVASAGGGAGEIDSIFVSPLYRSRGIADKLMRIALDWLAQVGAQRIVIKVGVGNEEVFGFYARYGFFPRLTELRLADDGETR